ncbi:MAG: hypothetical protein ACI8WM_002677 [Burkholderiaceae bacterium]|jgi:hypothetical protein
MKYCSAANERVAFAVTYAKRLHQDMQRSAHKTVESDLASQTAPEKGPSAR